MKAFVLTLLAVLIALYIFLAVSPRVFSADGDSEPQIVFGIVLAREVPVLPVPQVPELPKFPEFVLWLADSPQTSEIRQSPSDRGMISTCLVDGGSSMTIRMLQTESGPVRRFICWRTPQPRPRQEA